MINTSLLAGTPRKESKTINLLNPERPLAEMLTNLKGVQKNSAAIMTYQKHVCEMLKLAHFLWETHVEIPQKIGRE